MAAFIEPLPGLLDDPLLHLPELPSLSDVRIPPLRDPFPSRFLTLPSLLEPNAPSERQTHTALQLGTSKDVSQLPRTSSPATPANGPSFAEVKKPDIAISALVDFGTVCPVPKLLPPSFVNLAAVENNPSSPSRHLENPPCKRIKLDHGEYLQLPRPNQKEVAQRVPMLPVMVNGIHEPPPSAALLPPMELEAVKAILASMSGSPPPPSPIHVSNVPEADREGAAQPSPCLPLAAAQKDECNIKSNVKPARPWKRWSDDETAQLLRGVAKHGPGKWKDICADPELSFCDRRPMDLKDRFRTCVPGAGRKKSRSLACDSIGSKISELVTPAEPEHSAASVAITRTHSASHNSKQADAVITASKTVSIDLTAALVAHGKQRVRKPWTEEEHNELIKGFAKHGYHWTAIHKDDELNLSHRKATDIRDKFRSLFPQQYMDAEGSVVVNRPRTGKKSLVNSPTKAAKAKKADSPPVPRGQQNQQHQGSILPPASLSIPAKLNNTEESAMSSNSTDTSTSNPNDNNHHHHLLQQQQKQQQYHHHHHHHQQQQEPPHLSIPVSSISAATATATQTNLTTLPSLSLGNNTNWDWDDNKLAPLVDWEEFGI